jgi:hypothetical protein
MWCLLISVSADAATEPVAAAHISGPVQIDGRLSEAFWTSGPWCNSFRRLKSSGSAPQATRFAVRVSDDRLLIAIVAEVPGSVGQSGGGAAPQAGQTALVGYGKEDALELFVAPTHAGEAYGHWYLTTRGLISDTWRRTGVDLGGLAEWRSGAQVATRVEGGIWTTELAIPLASMNLTPDSVAGQWRILVGRVHPSRQGSGVLYSVSAPVQDSFHNVPNYQTLKVEHSGLAQYLWRLRLAGEGKVLQKSSGELEYQINVEVTRLNPAGRKWFDAGLHAELALGERTVVAEQKAAIAVNRPVNMTLSFVLPKQTSPGWKNLDLRLYNLRQKDQVLNLRGQEVELAFQPVSIQVRRPFYRDSIYATEKIDSIKADVILGLDNSVLDQASLVANLRPNAGGQVAAIGSAMLRKLSTRQTVEIAIPEDLPVGDYALEVDVTTAAGQKWQTSRMIHKLAPAKDEWRLDESLALLHNNKPFMPVGWFGWKEAEDPAAQGINTAHVYHLPRQGIRKTLAWLDRMHAEGVVALVDPWPESLYRKNQKKPLSDKEAAELRHYVGLLKNHPAVMAYYIYDEPEFIPVLPQRLEQAYELIKEEDPYHPCVTLNMQFQAIARYARSADILMPDTYPSFRDNAPPLAPISKIAKHLAEARRVAEGRKAVWVAPQAFTWDQQTPAARAPRFNELRNQQVQAIATGATGFIWWIYGRQLNEANLALGMPFLNREATRLKSAILAKGYEGAFTLKASLPEQLHSSVRQLGEHFFVFTVNTSETEAQQIAFDLPALGSRMLYAVSESLTCQPSGGSWSDRLEAYGTRIYTTDPDFAEGQTLGAVQRRIDEATAALAKPGNLAYRGVGAKVTTSAFLPWGAFPKRLNDGYVGRSWQAKQQSGQSNWVKVAFAKPQTVGRVVVYTTATRYKVVVYQAGKQTSVASGNKDAQTPLVVPFKSMKADAVQVILGVERGSLMVQEIEVYD